MKTKIPLDIQKGLTESKSNSKLRQAGDPIKYDWVPTDAKPCEDCGETVFNRTVTAKKSFTPCAHWRAICDNCNRHLDRDTGEFCKINDNSTYFYRKRFSKD